jgi:NADH:ubiquinone oxidoreductase subunit B-like Fe-S oxidoreductase
MYKKRLSELGLNYGSFDAMLLTVQEEYDKKTLVGNDYCTLRYYAMHIKLLIETYGYAMEDIDNESAIQNDMLCVGDFDGYNIDDILVLQGLFLNKYNRVIAMVYDKMKDKFIYYLVN